MAKISKMLKLYVLFILITCFFVLPRIASAFDERSTEIKIFKADSSPIRDSITPFGQNFNGGGSVAICDLDGNGVDEIVVSAGIGGGPQVRIFDSKGSAVFTPGFFAYDVKFHGGVNVACGDLDGDGNAEIVTAPKSEGSAHIRVFNRYGEPVFTPGFFAYDRNMKAGFNVAVGDIDGGGLKEIIVAPAYNTEPKVNIFNRYGDKLDFNVYPFHPDFTGGVSLAVANVDGGIEDELILGVQSQDSAWIKVIKVGANQPPLGEFKAFPQNFMGGVNLAGADIDGDGLDEIVAAANTGGGPQVRAFEAYGEVKSLNFFAYENDFRGGVNIASGDINGDGDDELITIPNKKNYQGKVSKILVDISEQRLWAYEGGLLLKTFLVSTGIPGMDTQPGNFKVSQKIYSKLYSGPDYYLPNTLWNMRFDGSRLLHGAYWHNNFGHKMSHGCVNIAYPDAEWLYNFTSIGTTVIVQP
ncbi:MAG: L,D-transpeptidase family protein [Patescibacteria group bacterium]|jgi:hypothetical protein